MKKITKLVIGTLGALSVAVAVKKHQEDKNKRCIECALNNAKAKLTDECVTGSWVEVTPIKSDDSTKDVIVGGVMSDVATYDFVADAQSGQIISFEKQVR